MSVVSKSNLFEETHIAVILLGAEVVADDETLASGFGECQCPKMGLDHWDIVFSIVLDPRVCMVSTHRLRYGQIRPL